MIINSMKSAAYSAPEISVVDYETESGLRKASAMRVVPVN